MDEVKAIYAIAYMHPNNARLDSDITTTTTHASKRLRISSGNGGFDQTSSSSSTINYIIPSQLRSMVVVDNLLKASSCFGLELDEETHQLQQVMW